MATGLGRQCMDMVTSVHHMIAMQAGEKHRVVPLRTNGMKVDGGNKPGFFGEI